ncbi:acetyltransferase (GNAT) family protein [Methanosarcina mazei Tuc01]|uniref:Acetyltransferase (GNAT) family protein n=1 Tax=Methanosarcina mazei Tuc01 TaxID=1236903 RepID=M1QBK3_METMZ|nr:GNAT family N-acetyltransferase [Methanosarcina mazei]AGF97603.1 acetyltransferase (GNAT) family protein [Methanosarcina mazei Tuc01]
MIIQMYDDSRMDEVREVVLGVLLEHGFEYDRLKDADLKDINSYYLSKDGAFFVGIDNGRVVGTAGVRKLEENMCEIRRIYLKKEYRGKGNKTDPALKKAINMYLKHGFSFVMKKDGYMYFEKRF